MGGLFAAVGVGLLFLDIIPSMKEERAMRSWEQVEAEVLSANLAESQSEDSTTYKAEGSYRYTWEGRQYTGNRINVDDNYDNIGSYHRRQYNKLRSALDNKQPILIYVNPDAPQESIVDPEARIELLLFSGAFALVFGGLGFVMLWWSWRHKVPKPTAETAKKPWLLRAEWQANPIYSSARSGMLAISIGALIWNAVSFPIAWFVLQEEGAKGLALLVLLFPLIGVFLFAVALKQIYSWRRLGRTPLYLDPFPASLGGNFGGYVEINRPHVPGVFYQLSIACVHSYESGSGKNRSRKEKNLWHEQGMGDANGFNNRTRVKFRFDLPAKLKESDVDQSGEYYLWRFHIECTAPNARLDRSFEVPVFATKQLSQIQYTLSTANPQLSEYTLSSLETFLDISRKGTELQLHMRTGKRVGMAIFGFMFAAISLGIALAFTFNTDSFWPKLFVVLTSLILLPAIYALGRSRLTTIGPQGIKVQNFFLGIPVSGSNIAKSDFLKFERKDDGSMSSGSKHTQYFALQALTRDGKKLKVVDRLQGRHEVDKLIESVKTLTGYE